MLVILKIDQATRSVYNYRVYIVATSLFFYYLRFYWFREKIKTKVTNQYR